MSTLRNAPQRLAPVSLPAVPQDLHRTPSPHPWRNVPVGGQNAHRSQAPVGRQLDSLHHADYRPGPKHDHQGPDSRRGALRKGHGATDSQRAGQGRSGDEIWGYVYKKEAHKFPFEKDDDSKGDAYCYVAMEKHSKLVLNFALGRRNQATTDIFIEGLRHATAPGQRFQITTDGFQPYVSAITTTLSDRCDYAMQIKEYAVPQEEQRRYSPAEVISVEVVPVMGNPDTRRICTSHIERQNLTIRMCVRCLTRLTNAFSKKWENLWAAYCLHFA